MASPATMTGSPLYVLQNPRDAPFARTSGDPAPASSPLLRDQIEAIEVHHLVPRGDEVAHELLLCVLACVDLRERAELGMRTEDEVGGRCGPPHLTCGAITTLVHRCA